MNAASIESSERLNRVLDLLSQGGEFSTLDIIKNANVCAVNSIISELRQNGFEINCQRRGDKWFYKLEKSLVDFTNVI
ncbi:Helix-turn-helix domain containing protein [uncultured Caudovirales phage]|uniref:Helix-turn-helix domain containing protein n=1 Tax=uncultured Caudovirales phage TaxID=2100421 RepID=A0A6J5NWX6_9CAUD|nr:Helix-turn-helix domain containing protein [uncultured Caudovirales phage]